MAPVHHYGSGNTHIGWNFVICRCFPTPEVAILDFIMAFGDNFWILNGILVKEKLIGWYLVIFCCFQKPEVAILEFKMLSVVDFSSCVLF